MSGWLWGCTRRAANNHAACRTAPGSPPTSRGPTLLLPACVDQCGPHKAASVLQEALAACLVMLAWWMVWVLSTLLCVHAHHLGRHVARHVPCWRPAEAAVHFSVCAVYQSELVHSSITQGGRHTLVSLLHYWARCGAYICVGVWQLATPGCQVVQQCVAPRPPRS